jgi:hypothetical protein
MFHSCKMFPMMRIAAASNQIKQYFTPPPGTTLWRGRAIVCLHLITAASALYITFVCIRRLAQALFSQKPVAKRRRQLPPHFANSSQRGPSQVASPRPPSFRARIETLLTCCSITSKTVDAFMTETLVPRGIKTVPDLQIIFETSLPVLQKLQKCHAAIQEHHAEIEKARTLLTELETRPPVRKLSGLSETFNASLLQQALHCRYEAVIATTQKHGGSIVELESGKAQLHITEENWKAEVAKLRALLDDTEKSFPSLVQANKILASLQNDLFPEALNSRLTPQSLSSPDLETIVQLVFLHKYILQVDILLAWSVNLKRASVSTLTLLKQRHPEVNIFEIGLNRETILS